MLKIQRAAQGAFVLFILSGRIQAARCRVANASSISKPQQTHGICHESSGGRECASSWPGVEADAITSCTGRAYIRAWMSRKKANCRRCHMVEDLCAPLSGVPYPWPRCTQLFPLPEPLSSWCVPQDEYEQEHHRMRLRGAPLPRKRVREEKRPS